MLLKLFFFFNFSSSFGGRAFLFPVSGWLWRDKGLTFRLLTLSPKASGHMSHIHIVTIYLKINHDFYNHLWIFLHWMSQKLYTSWASSDMSDTLLILPAFRETLLLTLPMSYVGLLFGKCLNSFVQTYGPHSKTNKPQTSVALTWENWPLS